NRVPAIVDNTGETDDARQRFRVIPHAPLAAGTRWRFRCDADLTGAEGPLSLDTAPAADGGPPSNELAFETFGPLAVKGVTPRGSAIPPDDVDLVIELSNPVAVTDGPPPLKIEPAVEGFPEHAVVSGDRISMSFRALSPNTSYRVTVDA